LWSFVVQNFYNSSYINTRKNLAYKKLHVAPYLPMLIKYNCLYTSNILLTKYLPYFTTHLSVFRLSFWKYFSNILFKNQGLVSNNLNLSYTRHTISFLILRLINKPVSTPCFNHSYITTYRITSVPFFKTTYNLLSYLSYIILLNPHMVYPMWFSLKTTYTWLNQVFAFDIALNTFYFKIYNY